MIDRPEPGYFALRLAPRQPWAPAVIFTPCPFVWVDDLDWPYRPQDWCEPLDRSPYPMAVKIGERIHWSQELVLGVWQRGERIDRHAYDYLMARRAWARRWAPGLPEAQPAAVTPRRGARQWQIETSPQ